MSTVAPKRTDRLDALRPLVEDYRLQNGGGLNRDAAEWIADRLDDEQCKQWLIVGIMYGIGDCDHQYRPRTDGIGRAPTGSHRWANTVFWERHILAIPGIAPKPLKEATCEEMEAAAAWCRHRANGFAKRADQYARLAKRMARERAAFVRDLPAEVVERIFNA